MESSGWGEGEFVSVILLDCSSMSASVAYWLAVVYNDCPCASVEAAETSYST
jgi:hypothetical protein